MTDPTAPHSQTVAEATDSLAARAAGGEREALGLLYERYSDPLWNHVYRRYGDRGFADEITGETWEQVVATVTTKYDPTRGKFVTWLYLRADSLAASRRRREGVGRSKEVRAHILAHGYSEAAQERPPDEQALLRDESAMLAAAITKLTKVQREALLLTRFEGLTNREAAQALGVSEGAVKSALFKGLASLRRMVSQPSGNQEPVSRVHTARRTPYRDARTTP